MLPEGAIASATGSNCLVLSTYPAPSPATADVLQAIAFPPSHTVLKLTTEDSAGEQEGIRVTPEHLFWVAGKGWVASGELVPGDELFSALGRSVRVLSWEPDGEEPVYNFEVAETHATS